MTQEALRNWGNIFLNGIFFDSIAMSLFRTLTKIYDGVFLE